MINKPSKISRAFRRRAGEHQASFRRDGLDPPCRNGNEYMLAKADAIEGRNFYDGYGVLETVRTHPRGINAGNQMFANMLRSEHIPFNMFIPLRTETELFRLTMERILGITPTKLTSILIEHAPKPTREYLGDRTAFDVFCDCTDSDGKRFFIGIEVKYSEHGYGIGKTEQEHLGNYRQLSRRFGLYNHGAFAELEGNRFRQVWRNNLLAEAVLRHRPRTYTYYRSVLLYPRGNEYLSDVATRYERFLSRNRRPCFRGVQYEDLIEALEMYATCSAAKRWIAYLKKRYIVPVDELSE
jgi:hypothetical protein